MANGLRGRGAVAVERWAVGAVVRITWRQLEADPAGLAAELRALFALTRAAA